MQDACGMTFLKGQSVKAYVGMRNILVAAPIVVLGANERKRERERERERERRRNEGTIYI